MDFWLQKAKRGQFVDEQDEREWGAFYFQVITSLKDMGSARKGPSTLDFF